MGEPAESPKHQRERNRGNVQKDTVMVEPSPRTLLLQLSETDNLGSLTVDSTNFTAFEDDLDEQLTKLVNAWKHVAPPSSQPIRRGGVSNPQK